MTARIPDWRDVDRWTIRREMLIADGRTFRIARKKAFRTVRLHIESSWILNWISLLVPWFVAQFAVPFRLNVVDSHIMHCMAFDTGISWNSRCERQKNQRHMGCHPNRGILQYGIPRAAMICEISWCGRPPTICQSPPTMFQDIPRCFFPSANHLLPQLLTLFQHVSTI